MDAERRQQEQEDLAIQENFKSLQVQYQLRDGKQPPEQWQRPSRNLLPEPNISVSIGEGKRELDIASVNLGKRPNVSFAFTEPKSVMKGMSVESKMEN